MRLITNLNLQFVLYEKWAKKAKKIKQFGLFAIPSNEYALLFFVIS